MPKDLTDSKGTTTLLLIRHGQTDWNASGRWQGHRNVPLNDTGVAQANAIARRLADWPIQAVYSSDLQRAAMTAVPIAQALNLEPIFEPLWRERNVGDFEGLTGTEAREKYPAVWDKMKQGLLSPPNGEDSFELRTRAVAAYQQVLNQNAGKMVAVISHGGILAHVIAHVLELPVEQNGRFRLSGNAGLSIIEYRPKRGGQLTLLNDTSHLEQSPFLNRNAQETKRI